MTIKNFKIATELMADIDYLKNAEADLHSMVNNNHDGTPVIPYKTDGKIITMKIMGKDDSKIVWDFHKKVLRERIEQLEKQFAEL